MDSEQYDPNNPFHRLARDGYSVVSIVPPHAPIAPGSTLDPDALGKAPGVRGADETGWRGYDFLNYTPTVTDLDRWHDAGAGVGVLTGQPGGVVALDIDCMDEDLAGHVEWLARTELGEVPVRYGQAPKRIMAYRIEDDTPVGHYQIAVKADPDSEDEDVQLIETRGLGQQFVVRGRHPSGAAYKWFDEDGEHIPCPALADLAGVTAEQVRTFFVETLPRFLEGEGWVMVRASNGKGALDRAGIDQDDLAARDLDLMDEAVQAITNTSERFPGRFDYIRMACAIKAAYREDEDRGLAQWLDWCGRWEDGHNDPDQAEADWRRCKPPFEVGEHWLRELAREDGWSDAPALFDELPRLPDTGGGSDLFAGVEGGELPCGAARTDVEFWDRYIWVESLERFFDLDQRVLISESQFSRRFPDVGDGIKKSQNAAIMWHEGASNKRKTWATTYRPRSPLIVEEDGARCVNTWQPGPAQNGALALVRGSGADGQVTDEDVAPWLSLAWHLFPAQLSAAQRGTGEREVADWLLDWLAHQVQKPGQKCTWHPVIGGAQGTGKDTLIQPVMDAIGRRNTVEIAPDDFHSQWTYWVEGASLVVVQEVNSFHRRELTDRIKRYLAAPPEKLPVNTKGLKQYHLPNILNVLLMTNHPDAVAIEHGDRRLFVAWSDADPWPDMAFIELYRWLENGGSALVGKWLMQRDLSAFEQTKRAPDTAAKRDMQVASRGGIDGELLGWIADGDGPFERDLVTVEEVQAFIERVATDDRIKRSSVNAVGRALRRVGCHDLGRLRYGDVAMEADGKRRPPRARFYIVRNRAWVEEQLEAGVEVQTLYDRLVQRSIQESDTREQLRARGLFSPRHDDDDRGRDPGGAGGAL